MLEPEIAALHDGAVDHLGVFVEPSLVLLRTSRIDHDVAGPQSCCSVPRPNSILPLSIQTISAHLRDGSHEGLGLRRKEFQKPGASLPCARPAAPREAHNGIDAGWSDGSRPIQAAPWVWRTNWESNPVACASIGPLPGRFDTV